MKTIKNFKLWDEWYSNRKIRIDQIAELNTFPKSSGVILDGNSSQQLGFLKNDEIIPIRDYNPCGIQGKNEEQRIALHILGDTNIPLKVITGVAGSGKTLLACAHAIHQFNNNRGNITKIIIAKSMTPVGREIGFLKGSMEDKVKPWLGPFYDNFVHCGLAPFMLDEMMEKEQLEITPITFIQGRSISNAIIIIDEVQNLELDVVKQIVTRAAEGSEIILLGDPTQKFEFRVKQSTLDIVTERAHDSELVGCVNLEKSLRSPIADWAVQNLT